MDSLTLPAAGLFEFLCASLSISKRTERTNSFTGSSSSSESSERRFIHSSLCTEKTSRVAQRDRTFTLSQNPTCTSRFIRLLSSNHCLQRPVREQPWLAGFNAVQPSQARILWCRRRLYFRRAQRTSASSMVRSVLTNADR